ncbi:MAG: hypothetical protein WAV20_18305 [Blastocatellia bacterium]
MSRPAVRRISVTTMPFGLNPGEAIAALVAVVLLVSVMVYYFSSLRPEQDRLRILEMELDAQQKNIIANARPEGTEPASAQVTAMNALESLETFKSNHLKPFSSGRIALIKEINALAKKNSVTLTSGIDMGASIAEAGPDGETGAEAKKSVSKRKKTDEILNAIPSVSFRFTVFGQYSNLRTFINLIEQERQFLVVNSINLTNQEARVASRRSRGEGMSGIMLTIEMSGYFQPM